MPIAAMEVSLNQQELFFGSSSPFRKKILDRLGWIVAKVIHPEIDEKKIRDKDPSILCQMIARAKAQAVAKKMRQDNMKGFLITFDQVVVCDGEIREKPTSFDETCRYIRSYNAHPAETYSAVAAMNTKTKQLVSDVDYGAVHFSPFSDQEICRMAKHMYCKETAGAFVLGVEAFDSHVERIEHATRESIIGLPIELTKALLQKVGYDQELP